MEPMKPIGMARVWQTLRTLDQWLIRINNSWDGSERVKFGSATSIVVIAVTVVGFLGVFLLARQWGVGLSTLNVVAMVLIAICLIYTFRTPATAREPSGVPHE